jgi:hypothetical protein
MHFLGFCFGLLNIREKIRSDGLKSGPDDDVRKLSRTRTD